MLSSRTPVYLLPLLLVACGDSANDDDGGQADQANYLIGGSSCSFSGVAIEGAALEGCETFGLTAELPSSNLQPTGDGALVFEGQEYQLSSAIRKIAKGPNPLDPAPGPRYEPMLFHDGETRVFRAFEGEPSLPGGPVDSVEYGAFDATVALSITLLRPSSEVDPSGRVYDLVPNTGDDSEQGGIDTSVIKSALVVVDLDGDGVVSSQAEIVYPTSGQVVWSGTEASPLLTFNFVLEDGRAIEGSYDGGYEPIKLVPEVESPSE